MFEQGCEGSEKAGSVASWHKSMKGEVGEQCPEGEHAGWLEEYQEGLCGQTKVRGKKVEKRMKLEKKSEPDQVGPW